MTTWPDGYASVDLTGMARGRYSLRPLRWEDREPIRQWRNEQIEILRQSAPLSLEDQDQYFTTVVRPQFDEQRPGQVLVALLEDGLLMGYGGLVHLSWEDRSGEVSFITATSRQVPAQFDADLSAFLELIIEVALRLGLRRLTTEVYAFRRDYIAVASAAGFVHESTLPDHVRLGDGYIDSLLYGLLLADEGQDGSLSPMTSVYSGEVQERAVSTASLDTRLAVNSRYQSVDFHAWLMKRLAVSQGEQILDVGCGTGAQALRFLGDIGPTGTVSAVDISDQSVATMLTAADGDDRLQAVASDMAELPSLIRDTFRVKQYTLAQSTYSLYYSPSRHDVLRTMAGALVPHGRVAIFNPLSPHGMVELAARHGEIPEAVYDSLEFGPTRLAPWFRELFWEVRVDYFQSEVRVTSVDDFVAFYRATTYYDAQAETALAAHVSDEIERSGAFTYEKNGYLIQGSAPR